MFAAKSRSLEVGFRHLQIVLLRDQGAIADPTANDVQRERRGEFGFPARPVVLKQFRPRFDAGPSNNALQLRPQVLVPIPVAIDQEDGSRLGLLEGIFEVRAQFGEDRNSAIPTPVEMLCFGTMDKEAPALPIHFRPAQRQQFRRAANAGEPAQRHNEPPFGIGASVQNAADCLNADEVFAALVYLTRRFHVAERVRQDEPASSGGAEELFCPSHRSAGRPVGIPFLEPEEESVRVARRDVAQGLIRAEESDQFTSRCFQVSERKGLHIGSLCNVSVEELVESRGVSQLGQPHGGELGGISRRPTPPTSGRLHHRQRRRCYGRSALRRSP